MLAGPQDDSHADDDPLAGTSYRAVGRLGQGGMGEVFLADHVELGRRFVVKLLHRAMADNARLVDRMRVEAQALARLDHPHIVQVNNFGKTATGRPFIVMERLRGATLADELRQRGAFEPLEAIRIARQLLAALGAAHDIGVVHRDVKLSNLFLHQPPGSPRTLKVLDFGIAKVLDGAFPHAPPPLLHPTEEGVVLGTPRYMSPEAVLGRPVDHRSDLYSVGIVLYTLLAGRGPWDHEPQEREVLVAQAREQPKPPSTHARELIPPSLDRVVMKLLEKNPDDRFQSARQVDESLSGIEDELRKAAGWQDTAHAPQAAAKVISGSHAPVTPAAMSDDNTTLAVDAARGAGETVIDIEPTVPADRHALDEPPLDGNSARTLVLTSSEAEPVNDVPTRTAIEHELPSVPPASGEPDTTVDHALRARRAAARHPLAAGVMIAAASTLFAWWLLGVLLRVVGH